MRPLVYKDRLLIPSALALLVSSSSAWAITSSCLKGQYDATGGSNCLNAPFGYFVPTDGATVATPAPAGSYVALVGQTEASLCPSGTYSDSMHSVSCKSAEIGRYVNGTGQTESTLCGLGTYTATGGQSSCDTAPAGSYASMGILTACAAGTYNTSPGSTGCFPASLGHYVGATGQTQETLCPTGKYADVTGLLVCKTASIGYYVDSAGSHVTQTQCPSGKYTDQTGMSACSNAPIGSYALAGVKHVCPAGKYTDTQGQTVCQSAPAGSFSGTDGLLQQCDLGYYATGTDNTACTPAPKGAYVDILGATGFSLCIPGKYTDVTGQSECAPAPKGAYVSDMGATGYNLCAKGTYTAVTGLTACNHAVIGSYVDILGASSVSLCAVGDYADVPGLTACLPAPAGHYVPVTGATTSLLCPAGRYSATTRRSACDAAPLNTYIDTPGASQPIPCALGSFTSVMGATTCQIAYYGSLTLSAATYAVDENASSLDVAVNRVDGSYGDVTVDYVLEDATAVASQDYVYSSGTLQFLSGETSKTISLHPIDNSVFNGDKTFTVALSNITGNTSLGENAKAVVTIVNDDPAPAAGVIGFDTAIRKAQESDGTLAIEVVRSGGSAGEVSVVYSTQEDSAMAGTRYQATTGVIRFAAGELTKRFNVSLVNDDVYQPRQDFLVNLSNPQGGAVLGMASQRIGIIDNEQAPTAGVLVMEKPESALKEGASLALVINRLEGAQGTVSVEVGPQAATSFIGETSQTITFAEGELTKIVLFTAPHKAGYQPEQTLMFNLKNPLGAAIGYPSTTKVTLVDDELPPTAGVIGLSGSRYPVDEGVTSFPVTVTRLYGSSGDVSLEWSAQDGSAINGTDYTATTQTVTFADGETTKVINVGLTNDNQYKGARAFSVKLAKISGGAVLAAADTATVTINDNDPTPPAGILQFSASRYSVNEADKKILLTLNRAGGSFGAASVQYQVSNGTAVNGQDFSGASGTLYFNDGETSKTISLDIVDNAVAAGDKNFTVILTNPTEAVLGDTVSASITITDDDKQPAVTGGGSGSSGGAMSFWYLLLGVLGLRLASTQKR